MGLSRSITFDNQGTVKVLSTKNHTGEPPNGSPRFACLGHGVRQLSREIVVVPINAAEHLCDFLAAARKSLADTSVDSSLTPGWLKKRKEKKGGWIN